MARSKTGRRWIQRALRHKRRGQLHRDLGLSPRSKITARRLSKARVKVLHKLARAKNKRQLKALRKKLGRIQFAINARRFGGRA